MAAFEWDDLLAKYPDHVSDIATEAVKALLKAGVSAWKMKAG